MNKLLIISFAAVAALAPLSVQAGGLAEPVVQPDPVAPPPPPLPSNDWTGPYIGLHYGLGSLTISEDGNEDREGDTSFYGVHAGYLYDLGSFVLGAEAAYSLAEWESEGDTSSDISYTDLTLRAGYDAGPLLPYVFGGITQVDDDGTTVDGTIFGLGAAYALTENVLLGGEFAQRSFEDGGINYDINEATLRASYKF